VKKGEERGTRTLKTTRKSVGLRHQKICGGSRWSKKRKRGSKGGFRKGQSSGKEVRRQKAGKNVREKKKKTRKVTLSLSRIKVGGKRSTKPRGREGHEGERKLKKKDIKMTSSEKGDTKEIQK